MTIPTCWSWSYQHGRQGSNLSNAAKIKPSVHLKLLDCWVQDDLKLCNHLTDNEDNLIRYLTASFSALKKVGRLTSFKNKKMLANGILISQLSHLISLWMFLGLGL